MTLVETVMRGARSFQTAVTLNGSEYDGRLLPLDSGSRGISLSGRHSSTYEELYRTQPWIRIVVGRLARQIAKLPLKVYNNPDEPDARERVREGPLVDLIRRPQRNMGKSALIRSIVSNVCVHGNCVAVPIQTRAGVPPTEIIVPSASYWSTRTIDRVLFYELNIGAGTPLRFTEDEVLHFSWWKPGAGHWAPAPIEALRVTLLSEDATQRMTIASFENGARPQGAFTIEGNPPIEEVERARAELSGIYSGVDNTARFAILTANAKWLTMSHSIVESDLINLRKLNREEVAAVYDIPPPVVGILDHATFSNITEQHLMEYMDTIQPWTDMIQEVFDVQLISRYPEMDGQYMEFDFDGALQGDPVKRMEVLTKATGGPYMTPNEARAKSNLPPDPDPESDRLRAAANVSVKADNGDNTQGQ